MAVLTFCAVAAPTPRRPRRSRLRHWLGFMINELPAIGLCWLLASTALAWSEGDLATPVGAAALALAVVTALGLGLAAHGGERGPAPRWTERWPTAFLARPPPGRPKTAGRREPVRTARRPSLRRRARGGHLLRRRWPVEHARRLPAPLAAVGLSDARLPARRRVPQRAQEPRGAAPALPAGQPRLGLHQRELQAEPGRSVPRSSRRREEGDRVGGASPGAATAPTRRPSSWRAAQPAGTSRRPPPSRRTIRASSRASRTADTSVTAAVILYALLRPLSPRRLRPGVFAHRLCPGGCAAVLRRAR